MSGRPRQLIVTADDFGVDIAVNAAVERAFQDGILTSASLMVSAPASLDAIARARRLKGLAVGLHITLADGHPISTPRRVPDLVGPDGRFRDGLVRAGINWFFRPSVKRQLAAEIKAQFQAFASTGLLLDHVNCHKHLHLHPTVSKMILGIGRGYGLRAIRVPYEPRRLTRRIDPTVKAPRGINPMIGLLRLRANAANMLANDRVFGLAWTGGVTEERLLALIPRLPKGTTELYLHPAEADAADMPHAVPTYRYREELQALLSPQVRAALDENSIALTSYSGLARDLGRSIAAHRARTA